MSEKYEPNYAPGEVILILTRELVNEMGGSAEEAPSADYVQGYLDGVNGFFQKEVIESSISLRFHKMSTYSLFNHAFLVQVPIGFEKKYLDAYEKFSFVESALRRDILFEQRTTAIETLESKLTDLQANVEIPLSEYNAKLDEIIEYAQNLKK